nr:hypothetical protein [Tanacetum cinerariifolium]
PNMFEDIDDPTAKKTNDEDQVVEKTAVALPYKQVVSEFSNLDYNLAGDGNLCSG